MAKKKKKSAAGGPPAKLSDKGYLTSGRARNLPIYKCYANEGWEDIGITQVYVLRQHANTNITVGIFLIDLFCAGAKDSFYLFNQPLHEVMEKLATSPIPLEEISYELAHNIIYGAVAFAADYGIEPDPGFKVTQYILDEDTEDIELIDIDFGVNGKPVLYINPDSGPRVDYYLRQLEKHAGPGNYDVVKGYHEGYGADDDFDEDDEDDYYEYPEDWDEEEWEEFIDETEPEELINYPEVGLFMFEKTVTTPAVASEFPDTDMMGFAVTYEKTSELYSGEELEELKKIEKLAVEEPDEEKLQIIKAKLLTNLEKWPANIIFHSKLIMVYRLLKDEATANKVVMEMYEKFPDSMRAKRFYTEYLLDQERTDEVPAIFNHKINLHEVYPDRDSFHVAEVIDFNSAMLDYYIEKEDVAMANKYDEMSAQVHDPEVDNVYVNPLLFLSVKGNMIKMMNSVLAEAKQDEVKKLQLIAKLMKPFPDDTFLLE